MNKILVPLKKHDRIEEIVPYIEKVTEPGASVVFLIQRPISDFKWLQAYCGIAQCGLGKTLAVRRMFASYSLNMQIQLAQRRVFQTCGALHDMGLNFTVDVYTGSLRKTLRSYANNGDVQLLVMRLGIGQRIMGFLQGVDSIGTMLRRPTASSVLLLQPGK
ncbi:MAG TPA: hypothetical protein VKR81_12345 [Candidatus Binatia bacterium]|nr:hypothetical protein [Candidatus Binatia bacterium]